MENNIINVSKDDVYRFSIKKKILKVGNIQHNKK